VSRRADISPSDDARWVFNRLAEAYRARPAYPPALVDRLAHLAGGPGARAVDLGAGTGHLAVPLAGRGVSIAAVEPARSMLAALSDAAVPGITPVHASAERTGLPDGAFGLAVIADALQWIDPQAGAAEVGRLLAPGGALAIVTAHLSDTPFLRTLAARIARANPKARPGPPPVALFFSLAELPPPAEERFEDAVALAPSELDAVLCSLSYVGPALGPESRSALLADARVIAEAHGGAVWRRELCLSWAARVREAR
jgi:SAM-dependent methyltransferase